MTLRYLIIICDCVENSSLPRPQSKVRKPARCRLQVKHFHLAAQQSVRFCRKIDILQLPGKQNRCTDFNDAFTFLRKLPT